MVYQPALQSAAEGLDISINTSEQIHQQQQQLQGLQQQQQQEVQGQQQQQQQLRFGVCSHTSTKDTALVLNWCSSFLAQVFHMPTPPPLQQLSKMTLPRLRNGLYSVVRDNGQAVSMVSHVPTSESSTRITMLYTPEVCRGRGYGRFAGEWVLNDVRFSIHYNYPANRVGYMQHGLSLYCVVQFRQRRLWSAGVRSRSNTHICCGWKRASHDSCGVTANSWF